MKQRIAVGLVYAFWITLALFYAQAMTPNY